MGSWFSNLHIRKTDIAAKEAVVACITKIMEAHQYLPAASEADADEVVAVLTGESQWISVCSRLLAHDDSDSCAKIASPLSAELHTDVLGISCFDSDYLYLHLINSDELVDAWIGIGQGKELGINRRSNLTAWKKKVSDYPAFSAKAKARYILAEAFLNGIMPHLGLPVTQSTASIGNLNNLDPNMEVVYLYFRKQANANHGDSVKLAHYDNGLPCLVERESYVTVINIGEESKGLSVYFLGPYAEHEEITFSNVRIGRQGEYSSIELTRVQLADGQWAYRYHDPEFPIPPKVSGRMKKEQRHLLERERQITVCFTPHGNARQSLDITVVFAPDANLRGQTAWNVWRPWGSKKAFIEHHNAIWKRVRKIETNPASCLPLLNEEDFD